MQKLKLLAALAVIMALLSGCQKKEEPITDVSYDLTFLQVGKADAAVLISPNSVVVIDTGTTDGGKIVCDFLTAANVKTIDYLFLSHFDKDHIGGAAAIINNFEVKQTVMANYQEESDEYYALMAALQQHGSAKSFISNQAEVTADGITYQIFGYGQLKFENDSDNNRSLIIRIVAGDTAVLMTGDIASERIETLKQTDNLTCDLIKIPQHGTDTTNLDKLLALAQAKWAVIDCAKAEKVDEKMAQLLAQYQMEPAFLTCDGNVICHSDGANLTVTQTE
jgi:beta-lactamase superfamily II metal-dependent hydrolase